jgi:deoxyribose-phosphate aldolase
MKNLNRFIDHTLLKQDATKSQIEELCQEALKYHFFSVCINPVYVSYAHKTLLGSDVCVCTVIGFPLGANTSASKVFETKNAIENGASEIDMVINVGAIKSKDWKIVEDEIRAIKTACGEKVLKVACQVAERAGADFVKTSTGFSSGGATLEDIHLMRKNCTERVAIKASGGVRDLKTAEAMIAAGATRLGTSSGVLLMKGLENVSGSY